jgi:hypothetical protein
MKAKLSMAFQDLRGKDGTVVIREGRSSLVVTPHVMPTNPRSMCQLNIRSNFRKSGKTFESMSVSQVQLWKDYAQTIVRTDPISGKTYHPTAINAFMQLAVKFLQLNPTGTIPLTPPTSDFLGDSITVTSSNPSAGLIRFTASAGNTLGVTTELLLQRLASPHRKPTVKGYRHAAWKVFTGPSLTHDIEVTPGWYAAAYRFVKNSTGQMTLLVPLPVVEVMLAVVEGGDITSKPQKKAA